MKWIAILLVVSIGAGCSAIKSHDPPVGTKIWTSSELNAHKAEMDGALVFLRAYLIHEPGNYSLWDDKSVFKSGDARSCLSLLYPKKIKIRIVGSNRRQVLLKGTFVRDVTSGGGIYSGLCNFTGLQVTEIIS